MCFHYEYYPEFQSASLVRARKGHRCEGCGKTIQPKHLYYYVAGKFEGDFFTTKVCGACQLDQYRIHIIELSRGCRHAESWCSFDDVLSFLDDYEIDRSTQEEGQKFLEYLLRTGNRGMGTEAGWQAWAKERAQV